MKKRHCILIAEDDPDDVMMLKEAFSECKVNAQLEFVENGEELIKYLNGEGNFTDRNAKPLPSIIMIDLNMPKVDGRETLREIKKHKQFSVIPVIVFTTSSADIDINLTYELGVNCYITKPDSFLKLKEIIAELNHYWFNIVTIPENNDDTYR